MMTSLFRWPDDKELTAADFEPGRIVSLWDMIRFQVERFITICEALQRLGQCKDLAHTAAFFSSQPNFEEVFLGFQNNLEEMGLVVSATALGKLLECLKEEQRRVDFTEFQRVFDCLSQTIRNELSTKIVLVVRPDKAEYFNGSERIFSSSIRSRLSATNGDIDEAVNCFAFGRYTACVFHLMRLMERILQELAQELGFTLVQTYDKEWQVVINNIRGELNKQFPSHKDPKRVNYERILGHLETVKIAWRNPTMHPKATYTEEEARNVMGAVRAFAEDFVASR